MLAGALLLFRRKKEEKGPVLVFWAAKLYNKKIDMRENRAGERKTWRRQEKPK